jgi:trimethylamine--corrinoid protein Co-methyltransferase
MLAEYAPPEMAPGTRAALEDYAAERKAALPDEWY